MTGWYIVALPAIIGAAGSVLSAYIAGTVRQIAASTNGRVRVLDERIRELELALGVEYARGGDRARADTARAELELELERRKPPPV